MTRCASLDAQPPVVLTFDHPPSDEELQVPQPLRNPTGIVRMRKARDAWTIYLPRIFAFGALFTLPILGTLVYTLVRHGYDLILASSTFMAAVLLGVCWKVDRDMARLGPLVTYRCDRRELQIEGRAEPLPVDAVTEIVELAFADERWRSEYFALYLVVYQRDGVYTAERLFHAQNSGGGKLGTAWNVALDLAEELGVGYRRIELDRPDPVLCS